MEDGGTQNFYEANLHWMEEHPSSDAMVTGRRLPYHLQYLKEGKPSVEPKTKKEHPCGV